MHGSSAGQVRRAAEQRLVTAAVQADAEAILAHRGLSGVPDPYEALSRLAAELVANKDAWAARVNSLSSISTMSVQGVETVRVEISEYGKQMALAAKVLETLAKIGLDERRVQVSEAIAEQVAGAIRTILDELGLTEQQKAVAPGIVSRALLSLVPAA